MKKQIGSILSALIFIALLGVGIIACQKTANFNPPVQAVFVVANTAGNYAITAPGVSYKIPVGLTAVAGQDRTINIAVSSSTGAQQGTHYTLNASSITIPAGKVVDTLVISGVYNQYTAGRKDSLTITLSGADFEAAGFNNTFNLRVTGPCFDGDIDQAALDGLLGVYNNVTDDGFGAYGPYQATVVSITPLTATTARAVINNIWDYNFGDVNFIMDWTDPNNTTIRVESPQITTGDAGLFGYDDNFFVIQDHPSPGGASNKFSVCSGVINLRYQLGVYDPAVPGILGYFSEVGTTVLVR